MKAAKPPALATWLLEQTRCSATDAVAGDLLEEFHRGRSAGWYWRQALMAIAVGSAAEIRRHRVLAIRAILIVWGINYAAIVMGRVAAAEVIRPRMPGLTFQLASWGICFLGGILSGAIMSFLHRRHRRPIFLAGAGALLLWALAAILLLKRGAIHQHPLKIAAAAIVYSLVALT